MNDFLELIEGISLGAILVIIAIVLAAIVLYILFLPLFWLGLVGG